jgi:hypothetical protein
MARYRLYKNGIFGHRYKGYFIVKDEKQEKFSILSSDKTVLEDELDDYYDAEWEIDKITASPEMLKILQDLYGEEIYMLSKFFAEMMEKDNAEGLTKDEKDFYDWVKKIRARKAADKPY